MYDDLLSYYERELSFLRQLGAEFAEKYPKIASRLILEPDKCEDPHVERLIEAFAFIAGRVHHKLDDELPEVTEALLSILFPHYLAPIPAMSIVQFGLEPDQAKLQTGQSIPKGSILASRPVDGTPCRFRTCYPVTIWPLEVSAAAFDVPARIGRQPAEARHVLRLELRTTGGAKFTEMREKISKTAERPFDRVRFHLQGEAHVVYDLYELLFNNVLKVELRVPKRKDATPAITLGPESIQPVGFEADEGVLGYTHRSLLGYRLLQEYFSFPDKFLFLDLCGLDRAGAAGFTDVIEVLIYLNREFVQEKNVSPQTFRLHCTPIVNLFSQVAEPIRVTHTKTDYRVIPDIRRQLATEVYSVDAVTGVAPNKDKPIPYEPFYSLRHLVDRTQQTFWHAVRRKSQKRDDEGTEIYLSFMDLGFNPSHPDVVTLTVRTTCTNRDLPARLPFGNPDGDFQLEGPGIFSVIRCLKKPTLTLRAPLRRTTQWRLISHLSLNYLSLIENEGRPEAFQEMLKLYDFGNSTVTQRQIAGITRLSGKRVFRPIASKLQSSFARGLEIAIEFDEPQYVGSGVFLCASVLERFLAHYTTINSFTQLVASTRQREGVMKRWPPRAGEQIVL